MDEIYSDIARLTANGECIAVAILVSASGSTPREPGAKMIIRQDGSIIGSVGGSILEGQVRKKAMQVLRDRKPTLLECDLTGRTSDGMICGGKASVFIECVTALPTLYIFGGGHIAFSLARIAKLVGLRVVVIDDREEYANPERFPEADKTIAGEYAIVFDQVPVNASSYVVIVTRGHVHDQAVLEWALRSDALYIGMIGSRAKISTIYDHLLEKGIAPSALERVHAPIGLDIKAETPEEIAVSIMAEIIQARRSGAGRRRGTNPS